MAENNKWNDKNGKHLDEAWKKLQEKLKDEPVNPRWTQWDSEQLREEIMWAPESKNDLEPTVPETGNEGMKDTSPVAKPTFVNRWKRNKHAKWINGAVAAGVLALIIVTPAGNNALAAILNQFQMEQITTIQENEAEQLFNTFTADGKLRESENKFGNFARESGTMHGEFDVTEVSNVLNRKIVVPESFKSDKVYVGPSDTVTLTINVAEVNKAMSRLGASKLLPQSVDGKSITIELGESVQMDMNNGKNNYVSFTQQPVPKIHVDPSVDVKVALDALIDFPLLPEHLKSSLKSSSILDGGSVPLPVIADERTTMVKVEGHDVLLEKYGEQRGAYYHSMWIKDGNIYTLSGNGFGSQEELEARIAELIRQ
ncbi:hypothetical protein [Paenibacillus alkalitolerans]|uniref:hypothetical protein n=1 Tax=Paenibacillus alkalitolerans TaxID=2799335 RepID=UPI0018F6368E|nr:hypothetical protein [Paenibacillus alkalitolerans]